VLGYPIVRAEAPVLPGVSMGLSYDENHWRGERSGFENSQTKYRMTVLVYPQNFLPESLFVGAGFGYETKTVGYVSEASTQTWENTNSEDQYNKWIRNDHYITSTQTVGFRFNASEYTTASIRFVLDQPLYNRSEIVKEGGQDGQSDFSRGGREDFGKLISFHLGVQIP
jgi:hypothetical protein